MECESFRESQFTEGREQLSLTSTRGPGGEAGPGPDHRGAPQQRLAHVCPAPPPPPSPPLPISQLFPGQAEGGQKLIIPLGAVLGPMNGALKTPCPHADRFSVLPQPDCLYARTEAKPGGDGGSLLLGRYLPLSTSQTRPLNQTPISPAPAIPRLSRHCFRLPRKVCQEGGHGVSPGRCLRGANVR